MRHEKWGETPLACIIPTEGVEQGQETEIKEWVNARLAKTQRISRVVFLTEFPRNALGKVIKRFLRDELDP